MQEDLDDFESPYFNWDNDRMFDEPSRNLIDQIANHPRFDDRFVSIEVVKELAPCESEDDQQRLLRAAWQVFELTVRPVLETRASELVARALADPDLEALPVWFGESQPDGDTLNVPYSDPDPRVVEEFSRQLEASDAYQRMQEKARARAESEARQIVGELPPQTRDRLVLATRNAYREALLEPWIPGASHRRRGWIAYYAQRIARQDHEESVLDRYSAAAKILAGQGSTNSAIAEALEISVGRIDRLLERTTGQTIADDDPLCELVPEVRGRGDAWRGAGVGRAHKQRQFSRLSVAEKVALAEGSTDSELLTRLAKQGSRRVLEALIRRHCQRGDVGDGVFRTFLVANPGSWMRQEMIEAHRLRPLPEGTVLTLAGEDPRVLLDCDDATASAARRLGRKGFDVALAIRESDVDAIEEILATDSESESFQYLVELLIERPLTKRMLDSSPLLTTLLRAADQTDDAELSVALRLIACQSPDIVAQHIDEAKTSRTAALSPEAIVAVALGEYHLSGRDNRRGVQTGARALWEATDMTAEQSFARTVVAERGSKVATLETANNIYVAAADAIRSFRKSETTEYTYVHMHLTSAVKIRARNLSIRMPNSLPALGYHRETGKHPQDPKGPDVEAIVWPIPFPDRPFTRSTSGLARVPG